MASSEIGVESEESAITGHIDSGTVNPVRIPELVSFVFKYMSTTDLRNCRLVCNDWSHEAMRRIFQRPMGLHYYKAEERFLPWHNSAAGMEYLFYSTELDPSLHEAFEAVRSLMDKFQCLLRDVTFCIYAECLPHLFELLPQLPNLKSVKFVFSRHTYRDEEIPSSCSARTVPSVEHLSLDAGVEPYGQDTVSHEKFLSYLFSMLPNLTAITCVQVGSEFKAQIINCIGPLLKLQHLDFKIRFGGTKAIIGPLVETKCPLKKMDFTISSNIRLESIHKLLEHFSATFEDLTIRGATGAPAADAILQWEICVKLKNLSKLKLCGMKGHLNWIHQLKKLKILKLKQFDFGNATTLDTWKLHDLDTLVIRFEHPSCSRAYMDNFLEQFPNLSHLDIDNVTIIPLSFIVTRFGKLKILKLRDAELRLSDIVNVTADCLDQRVTEKSSALATTSSACDTDDLAAKAENSTNPSTTSTLMKCTQLDYLMIEAAEFPLDAVMDIGDAFRVNTLDVGVDNANEYDLNEIRTMMNKVDSLQEFKINGCSIEKSRNYEPDEWITLSGDLNRSFRRREKARRKRLNDALL